MPRTIKFALVSFVTASFLLPSISFAEMITDVDTSGTDTTSTCVTINNNLSYRNRMNNNKDDVMSLQDFLNDAGYLGADSVTGFFGRLTEKAVIRFQSANGLTATPPGFVGAGTRTKIKELSCSGTTAKVVATEAVTTRPKALPTIDTCTFGAKFSAATGKPCAVTNAPGIMCSMEARLCEDGSTMYRDASCGWHPEKCPTTVVQPAKILPVVTGQNFYWTDNTDKTCSSPKQFSGLYMYFGLQTFNTQQDCLNSVIGSKIVPVPTIIQQPKALPTIDPCVTGSKVNVTSGIPCAVLDGPQAGGVLGVSTMCVDLPINMHRGAESNDVKNLQAFLISKGLLTEAVSGFYGDSTVTAVRDYQLSKDLPVTGMVFDFTRQMIRAESCKD